MSIKPMIKRWPDDTVMDYEDHTSTHVHLYNTNFGNISFFNDRNHAREAKRRIGKGLCRLNNALISNL